MPGHAAAGAANDLRSYLQRSVVLRSRALAEASRRSEPVSPLLANGKAAPPLKSLDDVLMHLRGDAAADAPRAVLVMAARPGVDAATEAVLIAREHASEERLGVLVGLTRGAAAICTKFGIPSTPGFAELAAGRASFDDVIHVDRDTPLQLIAPGTHRAKIETKQHGERLVRIFEALAQVYHFIVLHADRDTAFNYQALLAGRLQAAVAVLGSGEGKSADLIAAELAGFGCTVLLHEQSKGQWFRRRST
jgi:hypothetical protein